MTAPLCPCCGKPLADQAYVCRTCGITKPSEQLRTIADMTPAARDIAHGLSRRDGGGASGKPGSQLPLDLRDTEALNQVQQALTKWVDHIGPIRGHMRPWFALEGDPIDVAATWLTASLEWMRHRPDLEPDDNGNTWGARDFLADIAACARIVAGIARGPAEQKYLGPCGAKVTWDADGNEVERDSPCTGNVLARPGAQDGACRACGARWSTDKREAWLNGEVRAHAYRAAHIADAYGVNVNTIRSWALRGSLPSYWRTSAGLITPWLDPPLDPNLKGDAMKTRLAEIADEIRARGGRLHYVGDVLDLAAADAARRAAEQAKRARRAEARKTAEMGA